MRRNTRGQNRLKVNDRSWLCVALVLSFCFVLPGGARALDKAITIRIGGAGGALGGVKALTTAFAETHPEVNFIFCPSLGSSGGIKAVLDGSLDVGLSSRPLKEAEIEKGAAAMAYAQTPLVFVTSHKTEKADYSLKDMASIYAGALKTWPDGRPIRLVMRPESESTTQDLMNMSPEMAEAVRHALSQEGMIVAINDQDNLDTVENVPGAIGVATLSQVVSEKRLVRVLSLDGVVPSLETLADGTYTHRKTFYLVTTSNPPAAVKSFVDFVRSPAGEGILAQMGQRMERPAP